MSEKIIFKGPIKEERYAKRHKSGVFYDKILEIYAKNPFKGAATAEFRRGLNDGSCKLNSDDFEQLLRLWGAKNIWNLTADGGESLLEIIVRYGSFNDYLILKEFVEPDYIFNVKAIHSWAAESGNSVFLTLV